MSEYAVYEIVEDWDETRTRWEGRREVCRIPAEQAALGAMTDGEVAMVHWWRKTRRWNIPALAASPQSALTLCIENDLWPPEVPK